MNFAKLVLAASYLLVMRNSYAFLGFGGTHWKEEVLLHDGSRLVVERSHKRGGRHELGSGPPVKEQTLRFEIPEIGRPVTWRDEYSADVGSANFEVVALHVMKGTPYIVTTPYGCLAYNKWGRPNPPYVVFRFRDGKWQRIPVTDLPNEFSTINLVIGTSNNEKEIENLGNISVENVARLNGRPRVAELRSILRAPIPTGAEGSVNCPDYSSPRYMSPKAPNPVEPPNSKR